MHYEIVLTYRTRFRRWRTIAVPIAADTYDEVQARTRHLLTAFSEACPRVRHLSAKPYLLDPQTWRRLPDLPE